eukprot:6209096-Pleurochrysis_carterae.AAC.2
MVSVLVEQREFRPHQGFFQPQHWHSARARIENLHMGGPAFNFVIVQSWHIWAVRNESPRRHLASARAQRKIQDSRNFQNPTCRKEDVKEKKKQ